MINKEGGKKVCGEISLANTGLNKVIEVLLLSDFNELIGSEWTQGVHRMQDFPAESPFQNAVRGEGKGAGRENVCVCVTQWCLTLSGFHGLWPARLLCPWDFPGKSTGVGCHFLLQGILPTGRWNPGLLHCRQILYPLSHQGSPDLQS